jgi:hypothetical protein
VFGRTTILYFGILAIFGVVLWGTLKIGSTYLETPEDLSGDWTLQSVDKSTAGESHQLRLEQSGLYLRAVLDDQTFSMQMQTDLPPGSKLIVLKSQDSEFRFDPVKRDLYTLETNGRLSGWWEATRTVPEKAAHAQR